MKTIEIISYLTESKLKEILKSSSQIYNIVPQFKLPGTKFRIDYFCEILGKPTCVEYDGHLHYTEYNVIVRDEKVEKICKELGYDLIRIPYFIQLTNSTLKYFFGNLDLEITQYYKHGFVDSKVFPVAYHMLGYFRYLDEVEKISKTCPEVKKEIRSSLTIDMQEEEERQVLYKIHRRLNQLFPYSTGFKDSVDFEEKAKKIFAKEFFK